MSKLKQSAVGALSTFEESFRVLRMGWSALSILDEIPEREGLSIVNTVINTFTATVPVAVSLAISSMAEDATQDDVLRSLQESYNQAAIDATILLHLQVVNQSEFAITEQLVNAEEVLSVLSEVPALRYGVVVAICNDIVADERQYSIIEELMSTKHVLDSEEAFKELIERLTVAHDIIYEEILKAAEVDEEAEAINAMSDDDLLEMAGVTEDLVEVVDLDLSKEVDTSEPETGPNEDS